MQKIVYNIFIIILLFICSMSLVSCDAITAQNINADSTPVMNGVPGMNGNPGGMHGGPGMNGNQGMNGNTSDNWNFMHGMMNWIIEDLPKYFCNW